MKKLLILLLFISCAPLVKAQCVLPDAAGPIQGNAVVCPLDGEQTYNIAPINNATSYSWSINPSLPLIANETEVQVDFSTANPDTYTLTIEPENSCGTGVSSSIDIGVAPVTNPSVTLQDPGPVCLGDMITWEAIITGAGISPTIHWKVGGTPQSSNADTMQYIALRQQVNVEVITNYGCSSEPIAKDSVTPYIVTPPGPILNIAVEEFCEADGPMDLEVRNVEDPDPRVEYTYRWFRDGELIRTTSSEGSVPVNRTGVYTVEVNNNICSSVVTASRNLVVDEWPIVDAGPPVIVNQGETGYLLGSTSVVGAMEWTPNIIGMDNPYWYEQSFRTDSLIDKLPVTLTVTNGACVASDVTYVSVVEKIEGNIIRASPSLVMDETNISVEKSGYLTIWSFNGINIHREYLYDREKVIDLSFLTRGIYIVRLEADDGDVGEIRIIKY